MGNDMKPSQTQHKTQHKTHNQHSSPSGGALCQDLATSVLDDYTTQLIDMVENSTHGLTIDDIRSFLEQYKEKAVSADQSAFKAHFQRCLVRREQEVFDPNRRAPFKRVLTMRFSDLFPAEGALDGSGAYVSRRMLPGLFLALEKMVGSEPFTLGHGVCVDALEACRNAEGVVIWEDLYDQPSVMDAVDDMLMRLVTHFDNPMKRVMWMLNIINNDLADPLDFDFEGDANKDWQLDEHGLINILRHLFRGLRHRLKDKDQALALTHKYGQASARQLVALITALDRAEV